MPELIESGSARREVKLPSSRRPETRACKYLKYLRPKKGVIIKINDSLSLSLLSRPPGRALKPLLERSGQTSSSILDGGGAKKARRNRTTRLHAIAATCLFPKKLPASARLKKFVRVKESVIHIHSQQPAAYPRRITPLSHAGRIREQ